MPMLAFIPWLRIDEAIVSGPYRVFSYAVGDGPPEGIASAVSTETLGKVLSQYRNSADVPLRVVTVLQYDGRPLGADLDEAECAAIFRFGQHLAVSGLSDRRYIGGFPDGYTAAGHYQIVIQHFPEPHPGSISLTFRRKGGHANVVMGQSDIHFVRPAHLVNQGKPNFNLALLKALQDLHSLPTDIHEHVDASVTQFLLANSDSPDVPLEAESIATYAALERVSNSTQRLDDIQGKLPGILTLADCSLWAEPLHREFGIADRSDRPVLRDWLRHIYRLRGNVAHGKPAHWQQNGWTQQEHLVAGAFIYPLVLKCLLARHGLYPLGLEDVAWTLGLEKLLHDRPFFEVPPELDEACGPDDPALPNALAMRDALRLRMTRWQRQFEDINNALLSIELSGTITAVIERQQSREPQEAPMQGKG